jgi:hypothetical protein
LVSHLPPEIPDIRGWERSSGVAEFDDPARTLEYELYVDPARGSTYAVTRYWIHVDDPEQRRRAGITDTEKLQWDVDGRTLRRFECQPRPAPRPCEWVEFEFDSPAYRRELMPILNIYSVHREMLWERDRRRQGRD